MASRASLSLGMESGAARGSRCVRPGDVWECFLLAIILRHLFKRQADGALLVAALDGQFDLVADVVLGNLGAQVGDALDLIAVDGGDDIALMQASLAGRAAGDDLEEIDTFLEVQLVAVARGALLIKDGDAEVRARHVAFLHDSGDDALHGVRRDGEADAFDAVGNNLGTVDADDLAVHVDERAAGVARVDGGVGLHELDARVTVAERAVEGADNAARHAALELKAHRVADGNDGLADDRRVGVAEVGCRQVAVIDLHDGEVRERISTDELARQAAAVGQRDDELARAVDDVVVRYDVALAAVVLEDDAGTDALALDRVVEEVARDGLVGDADDGRSDGCGGADGRRVARVGEVVEVGLLRLLGAARRALGRSRRRAERAARECRRRQRDGQGDGEFLGFIGIQFLKERFHDIPSNQSDNQSIGRVEGLAMAIVAS